MKLLYLILLFIIIYILLYLFNNNIENFSGGLCEPGARCSNGQSWGYYDIGCNCITNKPSNGITSPSGLGQNIEPSQGSGGTSRLPCTPNSSTPCYSDDNCVDPQTNLDSYCKITNNSKSFGVKSLEDNCLSSNKLKLTCANNYINGLYIDSTKYFTTPCLNKTDDFNTWCQSYNNGNVGHTGLSLNSIGAQNVYVGEYGGCYTIDGNSDPNKARAVCGYNSYNTLDKLDNIIGNNDAILNYNQFTTCIPINQTNTLPDICQNLLGITGTSSASAINIRAYDCNPGYIRGQCIKNNDKVSKYNVVDNIYAETIEFTKNNIENGASGSSCPCDTLETFINGPGSILLEKKDVNNSKQFGIDYQQEPTLNMTSTLLSNINDNISLNNINKADLAKLTSQIENRLKNKMVLKGFVEKEEISFDEESKLKKTIKNIKDNTWRYIQSTNKWFNIPKNNYICRWKDLNITSNSNMSISFWINIKNLSNEHRNIFHFSNDNVNCCNVGNRVPAIWVNPNATTLVIVNDIIDKSNSYFTTDSLTLNTPIFIVMTWKDKTVQVYFNKNLIKTMTYTSSLITTNSDTYFYIGDPWYNNIDIEIKNFTIFNTALNQEQISKIYAIQNVITNMWIYKKSIPTWMTITQNNLIGKFNQLGIYSNSNMSIGFGLQINTIYTEFRNIFHFSNDNVDCCNIGNRVPAVWIYPNNTNILIANDTKKSPNEFIKVDNNNLGVNSFIMITWSNRTVTTYINSIKIISNTYDSDLIEISKDAMFYIGDPWYKQDGGIKIRKFTIFNSALNQDQINKAYQNAVENNS